MKLTIAMTVMVAGSCLATLYFIKREVRMTYHTFLRNQFNSQWQLFLTRQESRFAEAKSIIAEVMDQAQVLIPLAQSNPAEFNNRLASAAASVFENHGLGFGEFVPTKPFFRYVDSQGRIYGLEQNKAGVRLKLMQDALAKDIKELASSGGERIGYLNLASDKGDILYEAVVTDLEAKGKDSPIIGKMVFGIPLTNLQTLLGESNQLQHGLIVSQGLHGANGIPDALLGEVKHELNKRDDFSSILGWEQEDKAVYAKKIPVQEGFPDLYTLSLFSMDDLAMLNQKIKIAIFMVVPLVPVIGLILSALASRRMTRPVLEIVRGTQEIRRGNYDVRVHVKNRDEIGRLAESFNSMAADLALKDKYRHVLSQVTDREVADRLLEGAIELGGEEREATVLFCDIRGFTKLSESMDPADVIRLLNRHMTAMTQVVYKHHGVVDKFIGDAIMVIFGVPRSYGGDAENAARCALEMVEVRKKLNAEEAYPLDIGIGLATGAMVAGCMGSEDRLNYTVVGARVNLGSRICTKAGAGEVFMDQATYSSLGFGVQVEAAHNVELKGVSEGKTLYRLLSIGHS